LDVCCIKKDRRARTLRGKFYFRDDKFLGTVEEELLRVDNKE
jgi:hypothetical protein